MGAEYATSVERAQLEVLGRIADAVEGIRFNLATNIASLSAENRQLQSSNNALADTLRRLNAHPEEHEKEVPALAHSSFILPVVSPTPRQVLNDTENGVADQSQQNGYEAQHINSPDANS
jgi:hypothetical protein